MDNALEDMNRRLQSLKAGLESQSASTSPHPAAREERAFDHEHFAQVNRVFTKTATEYPKSGLISFMARRSEDGEMLGVEIACTNMSAEESLAVLAIAQTNVIKQHFPS